MALQNITGMLPTGAPVNTLDDEYAKRLTEIEAAKTSPYTLQSALGEQQSYNPPITTLAGGGVSTPTGGGTPEYDAGILEQANINVDNQARDMKGLDALNIDRRALVSSQYELLQQQAQEAAEVQRQSLQKQLSEQRSKYLQGAGQISEDAFTRGRDVFEQLVGKGLAGSGLQQLGDVQSRMAQGRAVSGLTSAYGREVETIGEAGRGIERSLRSTLESQGLGRQSDLLGISEQEYAQKQAIENKYYDRQKYDEAVARGVEATEYEREQYEENKEEMQQRYEAGLATAEEARIYERGQREDALAVDKERYDAGVLTAAEESEYTRAQYELNQEEMQRRYDQGLLTAEEARTLEQERYEYNKMTAEDQRTYEKAMYDREVTKQDTITGLTAAAEAQGWTQGLLDKLYAALEVGSAPIAYGDADTFGVTEEERQAALEGTGIGVEDIPTGAAGGAAGGADLSALYGTGGLDGEGGTKVTASVTAALDNTKSYTTGLTSQDNTTFRTDWVEDNPAFDEVSGVGAALKSSGGSITSWTRDDTTWGKGGYNDPFKITIGDTKYDMTGGQVAAAIMAGVITNPDEELIKAIGSGAMGEVSRADDYFATKYRSVGSAFMNWLDENGYTEQGANFTKWAERTPTIKATTPSTGLATKPATSIATKGLLQ